ncbi:MAG TPA: hypothetical protein VF072_03095 [Thermoleophilaceae bacterium]
MIDEAHNVAAEPLPEAPALDLQPEAAKRVGCRALAGEGAGDDGRALRRPALYGPD